MKVEQRKWTVEKGWTLCSPLVEGIPFQLVLVFGDRFVLEEKSKIEEIQKLYPQAGIIIATTSGNISGTQIDENSLVTTALAFEKESSIQIRRVNISDFSTSFKAGEYLAEKMPKEGLIHLFLLSDGHLVNGSELIQGLISKSPKHVAITGGLAGDGRRFEKTLVGVNTFPKEGEIVLVGFYGQHLKFGFGSMGGWDPFGIERKITRSSSNILYELDGKSALDLYKKYLGEQANELPSSALLFPLSIRKDKNSSSLVRSILSINEKDQSMIFAGEMPEGWYAQLMKANFDRLVDGAVTAASNSYEMLGKTVPEIAILISCFGRRMVLGPRTEEELEAVRDVIGIDTIFTGFYSYGEIAPTAPQASCELHNQTMTITTISEKA